MAKFVYKEYLIVGRLSVIMYFIWEEKSIVCIYSPSCITLCIIYLFILIILVLNRTDEAFPSGGEMEHLKLHLKTDRNQSQIVSVRARQQNYHPSRVSTPLKFCTLKPGVAGSRFAK